MVLTKAFIDHLFFEWAHFIGVECFIGHLNRAKHNTCAINH